MAEDGIQKLALATTHYVPPGAEELCVFCPLCFRPTGSLKAYFVVKVIYAIYSISSDFDYLIACPSCMRKAIAKRAFFSIFLANLLFPILAISYLCQFLATFTSGHSQLQVANTHRRSFDKRYDNANIEIVRWSWPDVQSAFAPVLRVGLGVFISVVLLVVGVIVYGFCYQLFIQK